MPVFHSRSLGYGRGCKWGLGYVRSPAVLVIWVILQVDVLVLVVR
jgi:hypothetical protein